MCSCEDCRREGIGLIGILLIAAPIGALMWAPLIMGLWSVIR